MWWFCFGLAPNACSSVAGKVPATKLYSGFWDVLRFGGVPIGFEKLLSLGFWSCYRFAGDPRVDPLSLSTYRMKRCQEETSTSLAGSKRGSNRELHNVSSLVASLSVEELRSFC